MALYFLIPLFLLGLFIYIETVLLCKIINGFKKFLIMFKYLELLFLLLVILYKRALTL